MSETAGRRKRGRPKGSTARIFSRTYYLRQAVKEIRAIRDRKGEDGRNPSLEQAISVWALGALWQGRKVHGLDTLLAQEKRPGLLGEHARSIILDQIRRELNRSRRRVSN